MKPLVECEPKHLTDGEVATYDYAVVVMLHEEFILLCEHETQENAELAAKWFDREGKRCMDIVAGFDAEQVADFRKAYDCAVFKNTETFTFAGFEYLTQYAEYLLEYLEMKPTMECESKYSADFLRRGAVRSILELEHFRRGNDLRWLEQRRFFSSRFRVKGTRAALDAVKVRIDALIESLERKAE